VSIVKSGYRSRAAHMGAAFRLQDARLALDALARDHARLLAAAGDALPEDRGPALRRLRLEMAGRGSRAA